MFGMVDLLPAPPAHLFQARTGVVEPPFIVPEDRSALVGHPGELRDVVGEGAELRLAMAQGNLRLRVLRDVSQIPREPRRAVAGHPGDGQLDGKLGPVAAHGGRLNSTVQVLRFPGRQVLVQPAPVRLAIPRRDDELGEKLPDGLLAGMAEHARSRRIPGDHPASGVHGNDAVERHLEDRCLLRLAAPRRFLLRKAAQQALELRPERGGHLRPFLDGRARRSAEELDDGDGLRAGAQRKCNGAVQPGLPRRFDPR